MSAAPAAAAARGAYSGPSHLSGPFGGTEQGALWGVGPAAGGHPAAGGGGSPGDPRPLPQPGGGRGGTAGGAIHPAGCLGGGDGRRAAGFCQPVGFAPVSGEPDLPADAARRGGGGDRGLSASKAPAGPVGADVRAAAAEDAGGLRAGPGPGPGGLFPGLSGGAGAAAAPGGGGAAGGPSLHGDPGAEAQIPSVPSGTVSHGVLFCPAHGGGGGLPPAGEGRTGQDDPGGGPPAAAE